jgi:hypothetical protein
MKNVKESLSMSEEVMVSTQKSILLLILRTFSIEEVEISLLYIEEIQIAVIMIL